MWYKSRLGFRGELPHNYGLTWNGVPEHVSMQYTDRITWLISVKDVRFVEGKLSLSTWLQTGESPLPPHAPRSPAFVAPFAFVRFHYFVAFLFHLSLYSLSTF